MASERRVCREKGNWHDRGEPERDCRQQLNDGERRGERLPSELQRIKFSARIVDRVKLRPCLLDEADDLRPAFCIAKDEAVSDPADGIEWVVDRLRQPTGI